MSAHFINGRDWHARPLRIIIVKRARMGRWGGGVGVDAGAYHEHGATVLFFHQSSCGCVIALGVRLICCLMWVGLPNPPPVRPVGDVVLGMISTRPKRIRGFNRCTFQFVVIRVYV